MYKTTCFCLLHSKYTHGIWFRTFGTLKYTFQPFGVTGRINAYVHKFFPRSEVFIFSNKQVKHFSSYPRPWQSLPWGGAMGQTPSRGGGGAHHSCLICTTEIGGGALFTILSCRLLRVQAHVEGWKDIVCLSLAHHDYSRRPPPGRRPPSASTC